jgi:hypothetical protein
MLLSLRPSKQHKQNKSCAATDRLSDLDQLSSSGSLAMLAAMRRASSRGKPALPFAGDCAMMRSRGQSSLRLIGCVFKLNN